MMQMPSQHSGATLLERALLYLLIVCIPLQIRKYFFSSGSFNEWSSFFFYLSDAIFLLLCVLWVHRERSLLLSEARKIIAGRNRSVTYSALFLAGLLGSVVAAASFSLAFSQWLHVVELFLFAWYIARYVQTETFLTAICFFVSGMAAQAVIGITQFFVQHDLGLWFLKESELGPSLAGVAKIALPGSPVMIRAYGLFPHPNIFAFFLTVALFLLMYLFFAENIQKTKPRSGVLFRKINFLFCVVGAILLFALVLTFSRVALFACAIFLAVFFLVVVSRKHLTKIPKNIATFALAFLLLCFVFPVIVYRQEFSNRLNISSQEQSAQLRSYYTRVAEQYISSHPLLGVGVGHFVRNYGEVESPLSYFMRELPQNEARAVVGDGMSVGWIYQPVHNLYLLIASEAGLVSTCLLFAAIFYAVWLYIKKRHLVSGFGSPEEEVFYNIARTASLFLFLLLLFHGLFDHFFWTSQQGRMVAGLILGIYSRYV